MTKVCNLSRKTAIVSLYSQLFDNIISNSIYVLYIGYNNYTYIYFKINVLIIVCFDIRFACICIGHVAMIRLYT